MIKEKEMPKLSSHPIHWEQDVLMECQRRLGSAGYTREQAREMYEVVKAEFDKMRNSPK